MADLQPGVARTIRAGGVLLAADRHPRLLPLHPQPSGRARCSTWRSNTWFYGGLILAAAVSCFARAILIRRERLAAWSLMGVALAAWTGGEIYYSIAYAGTEAVPIPSPADAGYLAFYPFAYASLILLLRGRGGEFDGARWLDEIIVGSAVAALLWRWRWSRSMAAGTSSSTMVPVTNLAYPIADLVLLDPDRHRRRVHRLAPSQWPRGARTGGGRTRDLGRDVPAAVGSGKPTSKGACSTPPGRSERCCWPPPPGPRQSPCGKPIAQARSLRAIIDTGGGGAGR